MTLKWKRHPDYWLASSEQSGAAYEIRQSEEGYLLQVFLLDAPVRWRTKTSLKEAQAYAERIELHGPFDYVLGGGF